MEARQETCEGVYNFVLVSGHVVTVSGMECITLGHMRKGGVVEHAYFGDKQVVEDLQRMSGWAKGRVDVMGVEREVESGLVCGLVGVTASRAL